MAGCCECVCVCVESLAGRRGVWAIGDDCFRFDRSVRTCQQPRAPRPLRRGSSSLSGCVDDDDDDDVFLLMCTSPEQRCLRLYEADDYDYCSLQVHVLVQRSLHHCMWLPSCAVLCCAVQGCAVQCWEAKASASHLLLRHFLQLLLSREIAAPKLLNPASLSLSLHATRWCLRRVSFPCAVATTSFLVLLLLLEPMGEPRSGIGLGSGRKRARKGWRWRLSLVSCRSIVWSKGKMRKEAHDTEGNL